MTDFQKIDHLTKRCADLLAEMKRHERDSIKNRKRGDIMQKEKDSSRNELSKTVGLKEKLEKLCRELQKENNKLKVSSSGLYASARRARRFLFPISSYSVFFFFPSHPSVSSPINPHSLPPFPCA